MVHPVVWKAPFVHPASQRVLTGDWRDAPFTRGRNTRKKKLIFSVTSRDVGGFHVKFLNTTF